MTLDFPPEVIASWPPSNFVNPVTRGPGLWIVSSIFLSIATICVSARLYSRIFIRRWFGPDDALIVIAYISTLGVTTSAAIGNVRYDWNKHVWDMPPKHIEPTLKTLYVSRIFWGIATSSCRLSILFLYYRLLDRCEAPKSYRYVLHGVMAFTVGLLLEYIFTGFIPCYPIRAYWTWPPLPNQRCINDGASMQAAAVLNTTSELVLAILPVFAVYRLRVDPRQRWSVLGLLSLGFFVAIAGCFRTYYLWKTVATYDMTWYSTPHWICSEVEIDTALTCACAASLRPLVGRWIHRIRGSPAEGNGIATPPPKLSRPSLATTNSNKTLTLGSDHEGHVKWTSQMSRTIDLEGIGVDGFGYTVKITGPQKPKGGKLRKPEPWMRKPTHKNQSTKTNVTTNSVPEKEKFEVVTQKTFQVSEEYHEITLSEQKQGVELTSYEDIEACLDLATPGIDWSMLDDADTVTALPQVENVTALPQLGNGDSVEEWPMEDMLTSPLPAEIGPERNLRDVSSLTRLIKLRRGTHGD